MTIDPASISLLGTLGKVAYNEIRQLSDSKVIIHKGLTFYHHDEELEFAFLISLGEGLSGLDKTLHKIKNVAKNPVTFENVIEVHGYGLPKNEDLVELGIISRSENTATVDFAKLPLKVQSNLIFIKIRARMQEPLKDILLSRRIEKTAQHIGDKQIETRIEVALDYADLWSKVFDQYTVRDIDFTFTLTVDPKTIMNQIPKKQAKKIIRAARLVSSGNAEAIKFLGIMAECFLAFESDSKMDFLASSISTEPAENFFVKEISPTMQLMEISDSGYSIALPGKMRIRLGCTIEGNKITTLGKLIIDLEKFSKILRAISQDLQIKTYRLKF